MNDCLTLLKQMKACVERKFLEFNVKVYVNLCLSFLVMVIGTYSLSLGFQTDHLVLGVTQGLLSSLQIRLLR